MGTPHERDLCCGRCLATTRSTKQPGETLHCSHCQYALTVGDRYIVRLSYRYNVEVYQRVRDAILRLPVRVVWQDDAMQGISVEVWAFDDDDAIAQLSRGLFKVNGRDDFLDIYVRNVERYEEESEVQHGA